MCVGVRGSRVMGRPMVGRPWALAEGRTMDGVLVVCALLLYVAMGVMVVWESIAD